MKKILISAYLNGNLGDDLFVYSLLKRYPNCEFYFDVVDDGKFASLTENGNATFPSRCRKITRKVLNIIIGKNLLCYTHKVDALVKIGGSIFIEYEGWEDNWPCFPKKPLFVLGANYGPAKSESFKSLVEEKIRLTNDCCFRDMASFNEFSVLANTRMAPDIIFGFDTKLDSETQKKSVGISVISLTNRKGLEVFSDDYYKSISVLCNELQASGFNVCLVSFCSNEGDVEAIDIVNSMLRIKCRTLKYNGDIQRFLCEYQKFEYILGTRFHAMILGWIMGKRVFPLVYSPKQINVIKDISNDTIYMTIEDFCNAGVSDIINIINNIPVLDVSNQRKQSYDQYAALDSFIHDKVTRDCF